MVLTGHKTRAVFDRYNIVNEEELLVAGERLVTYLAGVSSRRMTSECVSPESSFTKRV